MTEPVPAPGRPPDDDALDDEGATVRWEELAVEVGERLAVAGSLRLDRAGAARQALLIVMKACGAEAGDWPSISNELATKRGVAAIDAMTARRVQGEPLQYVLAEWGFRHLDLYLDRRVLIPRPETEVVAGVAIAEAERVGPGTNAVTVVDLGTGSGAIGLSIASEHLGAEVWLTDTSADALAVARANIAGTGRAGARVRVAEGSWFEALPEELRGQVGVVVANPPYVADGEALPPEVAEWEPGGALFAGPLGTEDLDHLVVGAGPWLVGDGALVLEMSPTQTAGVAERAGQHFAEVVVEVDLTGRERVVVARRPRR